MSFTVDAINIINALSTELKIAHCMRDDFLETFDQSMSNHSDSSVVQRKNITFVTRQLQREGIEMMPGACVFFCSHNQH